MPTDKLIPFRLVRHVTILSRVAEGVFNEFGWDPCKESLKFSEILLHGNMRAWLSGSEIMIKD